MLLILLVSCSKDFWIPILDPGIEYPGMASLPIIMHIVIKTHVNHNVGPVVDTSCSHDGISVHLHRAIEYSLLLGWVTLKTWPLTTLEMLVVLSISFKMYDAKKNYVTRQPTSPRTLVNGFAYRLCHRYYYPSLMAELLHMYDVANETFLDQNVSCSVQNWSIFLPSSSSDW